ncbi:MAG: NADH-quinone oxidoreductase subunit NuoG [Deltaproteobacteria bacterium]
MPELIIDDRKIIVPAGTKVIQAAERLGIRIPRFCYHEALGSLGACRMCAVKFEEGPVKGIEMSCMIEAQDGMVVSTSDPEALEFRSWIIECLMINHPHDCPVCDEGGHCLLQDETVSGGHGKRRYPGKKRTYTDQDLGPFIQHEMNRCIHCWRCRRFYQEYSGYRDLGAMQIASHTYFGRFESGMPENPFSGNLIDICPTGVYTDKPARFKGRRWNFQRGPSMCIHCSLGCSTTGSVRYREVVRQEARRNKETNGFFICDRGRFGFDYSNHPDRIRSPRIEGKNADRKHTLTTVSSRLNKIANKNGPDSILCLGSTRCSMESVNMMDRISGLLDWQKPRYFIDSTVEKKVTRAVDSLTDDLAVSLSDAEKADFILALGTDPLNEAPMLALAMRQAWRNNADIVLAHPGPVSLPFDFFHMPVIPPDIDYFAGLLVKEALKKESGDFRDDRAVKFYNSLSDKFNTSQVRKEKIKDLADKLGRSERPLIICGTDITEENTPAFAADIAHLLSAVKKDTALFYTLPGPDAFGVALSSFEEYEHSVLELIESGKVKALVLVEQDIFKNYPDKKRLEKALETIEYMVVLDYLPSRSIEKADAAFPSATIFERSPATMVNQEGRISKIMPLFPGGAPVSQLSNGNHPAREFQQEIPGADCRPAYETLAEIYAAVSGEETGSLLEDMRINLFNLTQENRILKQGDKREIFSCRPRERRALNDRMLLYPVEQIFGTEELSCYSRFTEKAEDSPCFRMHADDANRIGLKQGDTVTIGTGERNLSLELKLSASMAEGVITVPRHRTVDWRIFDEVPLAVKEDQICRQKG